MFLSFTVAPEDPSRKVDGDTIIFSHVQERSSAVYQCNASNEYGYLLANAFVNVLGKKQIVCFYIFFIVSCYYTCMLKPCLKVFSQMYFLSPVKGKAKGHKTCLL